MNVSLFLRRSGSSGIVWCFVAWSSGSSAFAQSPRGEFHPAWSPDGRHITYVSDQDGDFEIFVVDASGGEGRQLTFNDVLDASPWFVPAGEPIVFSSALTPNRSLFVVSVAGGPAVPYLVLPDTSCNRPTFVAPGSVMFNIGVGTPRRDIVLHSSKAGTVVPLITTSANDEWATMLYDHDLMLFSSDRLGHWEIFSANASGEDQKRVTFSPEGTENDAPHLAPDGRSFVYQSNKTGDFEVMLYDLETGRERNLTSSPDSYDGIPVFSPDGARIAFESTRGGVRKIHVMGADGSDPRAVTVSK